MDCFFCGREAKLTREHVIPRWLRKPLRDEVRFKGGVWLRSSLPSERSPMYRARRTDSVLKRVCGGCNAGWMSRLEGEVRPLLIPLIEGEAIRLTEASRLILVRWALKTAAVFGPELKAPNAVSPALRRQLAAGGELNNDVALWAIPISEDESDSCDWRGGFDLEDSPESPGLNITGIALGKIAFEVVNLNSPAMPMEKIPAVTPVGFQRVSPASRDELLPSPSCAPSTMAAAGVPFRSRCTQILNLAVAAGLVEPALLPNQVRDS